MKIFDNTSKELDSLPRASTEVLPTRLRLVEIATRKATDSAGRELDSRGIERPDVQRSQLDQHPQPQTGQIETSSISPITSPNSEELSELTSASLQNPLTPLPNQQSGLDTRAIMKEIDDIYIIYDQDKAA